ncbi:hypothetical protein KZZ52_03770 [Dactylosporangium sp. AC04546]|uniref:hypothetical protein n=1 Tax=Dactylosporangium sp. AC04546 TaxID=2862460 RepID=UPI001EE0890D|nr:hypothetical protein [Dactylosporangium sp. AC04546]WVK84555.1 hypothetical protein KZZ52_03770 [Dactylosporangium sp. AC04546]
MRDFNTGPAGMLMMLVGLLLAASSAWTAVGPATWLESLPSIFIGLALVAVGYSLVSRARRQRQASESSDGAEGD